MQTIIIGTHQYETIPFAGSSRLTWYRKTNAEENIEIKLSTIIITNKRYIDLLK